MRKSTILLASLTLVTATLILMIWSGLLPAFQTATLLPLRPPAGMAHADWVKLWQSKLPPTASLLRGEHKGAVEGSFYSRNTVFYPVFNAPVQIQNRTGYTLASGTDMYLVQTGSGAKSNDELLTVIGGRFNETPLADYAGVVEYRGRKRSVAADFGLVDAVDSDARSGFFGSILDTILSIGGGGNILDRRLERETSFGNANNGQTLTIETNDLQLTVHVAGEYETNIFVVSPALQFHNSKGESASFRYLLRFEKDSEKPSETVLLPIDDESLLPIVQDRAQPLWKRVFAAGWASQLGSPEAASVLTKIATSDDLGPTKLRQSAIYSLGPRESSFALAKSIAISKKEQWRLRTAAAWALGKSHDPNAVTVLLGLLDDSQAEVRGEAIDSLVTLKAKNAIEPLAALLEKPDSRDVQSKITEALGLLGDESTVDRLAAVAKKDPGLRRTVITALKKIGTPNVIPALRDLYSSASPKDAEDKDFPVRSDVCDALGRFDQPEALALLQKAASDPHDYVRRAAVRAIARPGSNERNKLVLAYADNPDKEIQATAIRALAGSRSPEAEAKVLEVLRSSERSEEARRAAIATLGDYRSDGIVQTLLTTLRQEKDAGLRGATLEALYSQRSRQALAAIEQSLRDQEPFVAEKAARLQRRINGVKACPATLGALLERKDGGGASDLVGVLTLPGCRDKLSYEKVIARIGAGDKDYDSEIARLLKSWTGQDFGADKVKWLAWLKQ